MSVPIVRNNGRIISSFKNRYNFYLFFFQNYPLLKKTLQNLLLFGDPLKIILLFKIFFLQN